MYLVVRVPGGRHVSGDNKQVFFFSSSSFPLFLGPVKASRAGGGVGAWQPCSLVRDEVDNLFAKDFLFPSRKSLVFLGFFFGGFFPLPLGLGICFFEMGGTEQPDISKQARLDGQHSRAPASCPVAFLRTRTRMHLASLGLIFCSVVWVELDGVRTVYTDDLPHPRSRPKQVGIRVFSFSSPPRAEREGGKK